MVSIVKTLIRYMLNAHDAYSGTGMMMALYFIALMIIIFYCKDEKLKKSIIVPSVITLGILYVLVPMYDTFFHYLEFYDGRMFWLLMTPVVISVGLTIFIFGIDDKRKQCVALIILVPILLYCGEFMISNATYHNVENEYRLPQSAVDITEYVTSKMNEPKLLVPYTIAHPFRQISTDVHLLFGENAELGRIKKEPKFTRASEEMERVTPDLNYIIPLARQNDVNYILFDTVYTELCENGNINIYGYPADKNYVGDRTSTIDYSELKDVTVIDDESGIYWDLSAYDLSYEGTFGQYILYRFD